MAAKKTKKTRVAKVPPKRVVQRASAKQAVPKDPPLNPAIQAYRQRQGLAPNGMQTHHADGSPTQAFMDSEDEKATVAALAGEALEAAVNGTHPIFGDLDRAEALKGSDVTRLKNLLADADAKLVEFAAIEEAVLSSFNEGAEPGQKITRESIPEAVQEVLDLLTAARLDYEESGDAGNEAYVEKTNRAAYEAVVAESVRWQNERDAALTTARASRDTADAAIKEAKAAKAAQAANAALSYAFVAMVNDTAAVLDLSEASEATRAAVAAAMAQM